ncbi:hypothetical protein BGZ61DRAFT_369179 [Ilyonectria robusta]|uniref:uncharacterized protein n=1 Tax=Ilyonectria robusta TaxID=1079257 RepID=UPI001E8DB75E|nr:uncharacterized protein BGZ61DRAFT_369179 [Ilyonectria robusta]KAH8661318.1 hypothetical protein BGZ61DRAFT_369179 [Ilyonectria robusta]
MDLPPVFLLSTHLQPAELHELEGKIGSLTYDINEAEVVVGNISRRERAMFELRRAKLETVPLQKIAHDGEPHRPADMEDIDNPPELKRRKLSGTSGQNRNIVKVVKLAWIKDSLEQGEVLPVDPYLLYEARKPSPDAASKPTKTSPPSNILERAAGDQLEQSAMSSSPPRTRHRSRLDTHSMASHSQPPPSLARQTTSEHDISLPLIPDFLTTTYSCQRPTPINPPNDEFVEALKQVRTIRLLQGDQVGVRAYSTSIATVAAYPYLLKTSQEVSRLPGCGAKIAELYQQWKEAGHISEARKAESEAMVSVLQLFYDIWGVGDATAREFYRKGWRDLDDLVEYGWSSLSRSQQIGVKYYDELKLKIPRDEAESIGATVLDHARQIDAGFEMVIVGGFRRGKKECGDVDVLLSHRDDDMTVKAVDNIVMSLEKAQLITHTLTLSTRNSERGQAPLPWRGETGIGSGFDTLDKAMVVWQDSRREDAPHRRVDIIVSPWKTVGCAVLGWSGGTTFQRDLRRYCKKEKGWKFDSSGIRSRADGAWVDLEGSSTGSKAPDMETAERRTFEGLGLAWRRPEERCTG